MFSLTKTKQKNKVEYSEIRRWITDTFTSSKEILYFYTETKKFTLREMNFPMIIFRD